VRLAIASDLHVEFERPGPSRPGRDWLELVETRRALPGHPPLGPLLNGVGAVDLLVLAGDIALGVDAVAYAEAAARYLGCPAALVPGNHEYYHGDMAEVAAAMGQAAAATKGRVLLLDDSHADLRIAGRTVRLLGSTLWTDYALFAANDRDAVPYAMLEAASALNDHRAIRCGEAAFSPAEARHRHLATRGWLEHAIATARQQADTVIVVTHHAPTPQGGPAQYRATPLAPAFVSDMEAEVARWAPDLWVHGHTHYSHRTLIGTTPVVAAQRGYVGAEPDAERFHPLVIEL
jgi:predicted phosphohydrolase